MHRRSLEAARRAASGTGDLREILDYLLETGAGRRLVRLVVRGARAAGRGRPGAGVAQRRRRAGAPLPGGDRRGGHVRPRGRAPPRAGRRRARRHREERGRRRHVVREPLPGLPGRRPEPHVQLLVLPAPRLAGAVQPRCGAARLLPPVLPTRSACAGPSASAPRSSPPASGTRSGDWQLQLDSGETPSRRRSRERGRPAQPPELPGHPRPGDVRRPVRPLGRLGSVGST